MITHPDGTSEGSMLDAAAQMGGLTEAIRRVNMHNSEAVAIYKQNIGHTHEAACIAIWEEAFKRGVESVTPKKQEKK